MDALSGLGDVPILEIKDENPDAVAFGGFGEIHRARLMDGRMVAVKYCRITSVGMNAMRKDFRREVKTWFPLDHQNLVKLLGVVPNPLQRGGSSFPGMITKWHERGHAMKYLQDKGMQGVTSLRLKIVTDAALGLQHLHSKGLLHGDLKGNNILIDENEMACLTDFGLSTILIEGAGETLQRSDTNAGGNARWQDPVLALGDANIKHTYDTDVFAFGRLMLEILSNDIPFSKRTQVQVISALVQEIMPEIHLPPDLDERVENIMRSCWSKSNRPSALHIARSLNDIALARNWKPLTDVRYDIGPDSRDRTYRGKWAEFDGHKIEVALSIQRWGDHRETERYSKKAVTRLVATLMSLIHPHILQVFGAYPTHRGDALVMPWMCKGLLLNSQEYSQASFRDKLMWVVQLSSGIEYLHSRPIPIVHGKLSQAELYLGDRNEAVLRVTLAYYISTESREASTGDIGDIVHTAPELLVGEVDDHTTYSDIWALGMTAYEILSGQFPFYGMHPVRLVYRIIQEGYLPSRPTDGEITDAIWELLQSCWAQPEKRITAAIFHQRLREIIV